ncbi:hypothetical protein HRH25_16205 [Flavisolibacter sp. BT320]|nr:hypothetical protein [Flavisolibacter longurius]
MALLRLLFFGVLGIGPFQLLAQDSIQSTEALSIPANVIASLSQKSSSIEEKLDKQTAKYLSKLQKQEQKLKAKLWKQDSSLAMQLFAGVEEKYAALKKAPEKLSTFSQVYSPRLDSLTTALNFLKNSSLSGPELQKTLSHFSSLQARLDGAEVVKKFLSERKQLLKENFQKLGMLRELKGFQKQAYYYTAQVRQYRELWEDPSKLEKRLLELVLKSDKFKDFFREHSQLASLFALPGSSAATASLAGLQTRASVQQGIADRFGTGPSVQQMVQQNLKAAQEQLGELKNKLSQYSAGTFGNTSSDIERPEGFKPNSQKTKTFLQRLEYGANIQSQKASSYFSTTSDLGLSLGYKITDNSSIGVGASYKLGWGRGWDHIRITHEGVGLRSYLDLKLKGSLYLSGGYEQNYRTAFQNVQQLQDRSAWQRSGLVGLSKKYKVSKNVKGDMKLLWDFLSYQQIPRTQAILFRIGYNLK